MIYRNNVMNKELQTEIHLNDADHDTEARADVFV